MPVVPTTETMSATTADAVSMPPAPGPFERDLPNRVSLEHHGVERAFDGSQRMVAVDECRADTHVDPVADEARSPDQLDVHVERAGRGDVVERHALDSFDVDPVERHP